MIHFQGEKTQYIDSKLKLIKCKAPIFRGNWMFSQNSNKGFKVEACNVTHHPRVFIKFLPSIQQFMIPKSGSPKCDLVVTLKWPFFVPFFQVNRLSAGYCISSEYIPIHPFSNPSSQLIQAHTAFSQMSGNSLKLQRGHANSMQCPWWN